MWPFGICYGAIRGVPILAVFGGFGHFWPFLGGFGQFWPFLGNLDPLADFMGFGPFARFYGVCPF